MAEQKRRYSIRIFAIEADQDVIFTAVDSTDAEKRAAVAQIMRLSGVPEDAGEDFDDLVAPSQPRKPFN